MPNVEVRGLRALTAKLGRVEDSMRPGVSDALNRVAEVVHNDSQRRVPVQLGNLKSSARIEPSKPDTQEATITYGGTAAAYALAVHETHATQSKYLEEPLRESKGFLREEVAKAVKAAVR